MKPHLEATSKSQTALAGFEPTRRITWIIAPFFTSLRLLIDNQFLSLKPACLPIPPQSNY